MVRHVVAVSWLFSLVALAQPAPIPVAGFDIERFSPNLGAEQTLTLDTADLLPNRALRMTVFGHYQQNPLVLVTPTQQFGALIGSRVSAHVAAAFGVTDWLEIGSHIPVVLFQRGDNLTQQGIASPVSTALGSPTLQARLGPFAERRGHALDGAFTLGVSFPLGNSEAFTRDPGSGFSFFPRLGLGKSVGLVRFGLEFGAVLRQSQVLSPRNPLTVDEVGNHLSGGLALSTTNEGLRFELSTRGQFALTQTSSMLEVLAGLRYQVLERQIDLFVFGGPGFGRAPGTPAFRVAAGLSWAPRFGDIRKTALSDTPPTCVEGSNYLLADCPELDIDRDGVPNGLDECPQQPGLESKRGCSDGDLDGDGVQDARDACVKVKGSPAFNGCPEPDTDKDGLADSEDACPEALGPKTRKGCPEVDSDGDGLFDDADQCKDQKGPVSNKGCPEKVIDADGDGVSDVLDNCPKEPGLERNRGCPANRKQLVGIEGDRLVLGDQVRFATGKASILPKSWPMLTQIAKVLEVHPEFAVLRIEGHTDNKGAREKNVALSQRRADAVKDFLSAKGVAVRRLRATGFGPDQPVTGNDTAAQREQNRRVEFHLEP